MSRFRGAQHLKPFNNSGFVCHRCRLQFEVKCRQPERWLSTESRSVSDNLGYNSSVSNVGRASTPPQASGSINEHERVKKTHGGAGSAGYPPPRKSPRKDHANEISSSLPLKDRALQSGSQRLPLDPSGRLEKPPFKKLPVKEPTASAFSNKGVGARRRQSLAQRVNDSKRRPGWAGLETSRHVSNIAVDSDTPKSQAIAQPVKGKSYPKLEVKPKSVKTKPKAVDAKHKAPPPEEQTAQDTYEESKKNIKALQKEIYDVQTAKRTRKRDSEGNLLPGADPRSPIQITKTLLKGLKAERQRLRASRLAMLRSVRAKRAKRPASTQRPSRATKKSSTQGPKPAPENSSAATERPSSPASPETIPPQPATENLSTTTVRSSNPAPPETVPPQPATETGSIGVISVRDLEIKPLDIPQPPVPGLEHGLDRVLFHSGVYQLQDARSRVYNFDPYLQKIMPVAEFDFNALKEYKTSSRDETLSSIAKDEGKKYIGSTSSMTGTLSHFHYLLSEFRRLNTSMISRGFPDQMTSVTRINFAPNAIFLRWKHGTYAIDADKEHDGANVLMMLGKSMEKLLTLCPSEFERYSKKNSHTVTQEERDAPESFQYTTMGDFLMRSQLDAYDPRLPGSGMFDLKTRAVVSVRMDTETFQPMTGYEIHTLQGRYESYEREYYDMMRSTMLKYMLQARMGRMDGIFVAYHNVERIFGFQYLPLREMDLALHGQADPCLGDQEFRASLHLLNQALEKATKRFPEQSLRLHFETRQENLDGGGSTVMWIFAEPMEEEEIDRIQTTNKAKIDEFEQTMMGMKQNTPDHANRAKVDEFEQTVIGMKQSTPDHAQDHGSATSDEDPATLYKPFAELQQNKLPSNETSVAGGEITPWWPDVTTSTLEAGAKTGQATATSLDENLRPLFVASLIAKSQVNDKAEVRPTALQPEDRWEVEFLLQEWDASAAMWARYEDTKKRRRDVLASEKDDDEDVSSSTARGGKAEKKAKKPDPYIRFLQSISAKNRKLRAKIDTLEEGRVPVIVGQATRSSTGTTNDRSNALPYPSESANPAEGPPLDVHNYLAWLYRSG